MSSIAENIKQRLLREIMGSGQPQLFLWYVQDALEEIEDELEFHIKEQAAQDEFMDAMEEGNDGVD